MKKRSSEFVLYEEQLNHSADRHLQVARGK